MCVLHLTVDTASLGKVLVIHDAKALEERETGKLCVSETNLDTDGKIVIQMKCNSNVGQRFSLAIIDFFQIAPATLQRSDIRTDQTESAKLYTVQRYPADFML